MQALKVRKEVLDDGKIVLTIPKNFGSIVEIIILGRLDDDVEFWNEDEIGRLGKTKSLSADLAAEDYSQWQAKFFWRKFILPIWQITTNHLQRSHEKSLRTFILSEPSQNSTRPSRDQKD